MHKKTEDFVEEEEETSSEDDSDESGRQGIFFGTHCEIRLVLSFYTGGWNVWGGWFLAANQDDHQNFSILDIQEALMDFHRNEANKNFFFEKEGLKWPTLQMFSP